MSFTRRSIVPIIFILTLGSSSVGKTLLDSIATAMKPGSWAPLRADSLTGDMVMTGAVSDIVYAFANSACWDTKTKQLMYIGGPHYAPMRFNIYRESTNGWRNVPLPDSWLSHTYDNFTLDSSGHMNLNHAGKIRVFDAWIDTWIDSFAEAPVSARYGGMEYFPEKNALIYVLSGKVCFCPLDTKNWRVIGVGLSMGINHNIAEYSPVDKKIYFGGGSNNRELYSLDTNLSIRKLSDAPINFQVAGALMSVDRASGHVLFVDSTGVYFYDPVSKKSGRAANSFVRKPNLAVIAPISDYGVVAFLTADSYPFLLYKHNPAVVDIEKVNKRETVNTSIQPNPFNPFIKITINLTIRSVVELSILSISGQKLTTLYHGTMDAGVHPLTWDGKDANHRKLPSGRYVLSERINGACSMYKMMLSK